MTHILRPLKDCTMELQKRDANVCTARTVINYLKEVSRKSPVECAPTQDVLAKWINDNPVAEAIVNKKGPFYDMLKTQVVDLQQDEASHNAENEHGYADNIELCSLREFEGRVAESSFDIGKSKVG